MNSPSAPLSSLFGHIDTWKFNPLRDNNRSLRVIGWIAHPYLNILKVEYTYLNSNPITTNKFERKDVVTQFSSTSLSQIWGYDIDISLPERIESHCHLVELLVTLSDQSLVKAPITIPIEPEHKDYATFASDQDFRTNCENCFQDFINSGKKLQFYQSPKPLISIIIVTYNQASLTFACLESIHNQLQNDSEVIIVDNGSTDSTHNLFQNLKGIRLITLNENQHFLRAANLGAHHAQGEILLFLNNDLILLPGSIERIQDLFYSEPNIGALGGKIIRTDGLLQEAGSIILKNGVTNGIGRGQNPTLYSKKIEVDYCSGALLATLRTSFEALNGFDRDYIPAYYEDVDFCVRLKEIGLKVFFDPHIAAIHLQHGSSTDRTDVTNLIEKNRLVFCSKHSTYLEKISIQREKQAPKHVLFIDDFYPSIHSGQGQPRTIKLLESLKRNDCTVYFFGAREKLHRPIESVQNIKTISPQKEKLLEFLIHNSKIITHIIISRPTNLEWFRDIFNQNKSFFESVAVIYDAEALFAIRDIKQKELQNNFTFTKAESEKIISLETKLTEIADIIIATTPLEEKIFKNSGRLKTKVLGHITYPRLDSPGFSSRTGILFVGNLSGIHSPNVDSMLWFKDSIFPKLNAQSQKNIITVCGSITPEIQNRLSGIGWHIHGSTPQLENFYDSAKVFIAPTRFASGIPIKVIEAASQGIPTVITPQLAEQLNWKHGIQCFVGTSEERFAECIETLLNDQSQWEEIRQNAFEAIQNNFSEEYFDKNLKIILQL